MRILNLDTLKEGMPGISKNFGASICEAASFCFTTNGHSSGIILSVDGSFKENFKMVWSDVMTTQISRTWKNTTKAAEDGAIAVAATLVSMLLEMDFISPTQIGSGIDYWLGRTSSNNLPIIQAGLEITGITTESKWNTLPKRLWIKRKQTEKAKTFNYPIYIAIVDFIKPATFFEKK